MHRSRPSMRAIYTTLSLNDVQKESLPYHAKIYWTMQGRKWRRPLVYVPQTKSRRV